MQAQNQMISQKKEEAIKAVEAQVIADNGVDKVNVLDIKVEENFDIDDIWANAIYSLRTNKIIRLYINSLHSKI